MSTLRSIVRAFGLQALGGLAVWIVVAVVAWNVDTASLDLVTVRAGQIKGIANRTQPAGAYAHSRKCKPSRSAVALSPRGLPYEGPVWGAGVECRAPRRVLVRVKATFTAETTWMWSLR